MAVGSGALPDFLAIEGLKLSVAEAAIKKTERKDLVVMEVCPQASIAGVFTKNAFCAAPVTLSKAHLEARDASCPTYLIINTGNANAGTGPQGMEDATSCCEHLANLANVPVTSVLPFSTGVIGERLPIEKILNALPDSLENLGKSSWDDAAEGIMTTDTRPKGASCQVEYAGHTLSISGISKGAGMIKPNMATMLGYVATDANIAPELCQSLLSEFAEASFNRITIDGDTSTNDSCMLIATGRSDAPEITVDHPDFERFKVALKAVFMDLAHAIVRDGEGATKFVSVRVEQAESTEEALEVAYTIAHSPLVKTALFASDPNWGRILAALGRANIQNFDLSCVNIFLDAVCIVESGGKCSAYTEAAGQAVMDQEEISIRVELGRGETQETVWTTDLSHGYVTINAEYRT